MASVGKTATATAASSWLGAKEMAAPRRAWEARRGIAGAGVVLAGGGGDRSEERNHQGRERPTAQSGGYRQLAPPHVKVATPSQFQAVPLRTITSSGELSVPPLPMSTPEPDRLE